MSSKNRLGLNLFEANLKRHPSVKGLFDEKGNKKSPVDSKNEVLILNADNKSEKDSNDTSKNQEEELDEKFKDIDLDNEDEKEESKSHKEINKISVKINRVQEKLVDNSDTYFTELNDEEKKQIIINRDKFKSAKNNLSVPLSYEFDDTQKEIDKNITEAMSKGKNFEQIEDKLKNKLNIKK
jgi:hypothetical protein